MEQDNEPMVPPPTYTIPVVCLIVAFVFCAMQFYDVFYKSRIEVTSLFVIPGATLLGIIGLFDPRVPSSILPNARGYPRKCRMIANACWVVSGLIGAVLYFSLVRPFGEGNVQP
jgi:hypothetical protein